MMSITMTLTFSLKWKILVKVIRILILEMLYEGQAVKKG